MNDIGAGICAYLLSQSAVKALVADRGYPDELPQPKPEKDDPSRGLPAYTYMVVSNTPAHHMGGMSGLSEARLQFDCYATTRKAANELGEKIRLAIDMYRGTAGSESVRTVQMENDLTSIDPPIDGSGKPRYVRTMDFLVWYVQATS